MSSPSIEVKELGICFKAYHQKGLPKKEALASYAENVARRFVRPTGLLNSKDLFWAIRDISFSVQKGEIVGIIGGNGSGKSTILKTIAGIFKPDEGTVATQGKIGALLELGAGFHPDLSGRDNIYLNGSILGLKKSQIDDLYNDIVEFSELEEFVNTPIKKYSSGMKVRLGFAIASHLELDILLIDEVLAVGDMQFQRKCFQKFEEFRKKGVTVLFVSHNLLQVRNLCNRTILLSDGKIIADDNSNSVINIYTKLVSGQTETKDGDVVSNEKSSKEEILFLEPSSSEYRYGNKRAEIEKFTILDDKGKKNSILKYGTKAVFVMKLFFNEDVENPVAAVTIKNNVGMEITGSNTMYKEVTLGRQNAGKILYVTFTMNVLLNEGQFFVSFGLVETFGQDIIVMDRRFDAFIVQVIKKEKSVGFVDLWEKIDFSDDLEFVISQSIQKR